MGIYDNLRNPSSMNVVDSSSAFDRNQGVRNAKNITMNTNNNVDNGVGRETMWNDALQNSLGDGNPLHAAAKAGVGAEEDFDWFNFGRWGEALDDTKEYYGGILDKILNQSRIDSDAPGGIKYRLEHLKGYPGWKPDLQ